MKWFEWIATHLALIVAWAGIAFVTVQVRGCYRDEHESKETVWVACLERHAPAECALSLGKP